MLLFDLIVASPVEAYAGRAGRLLPHIVVRHWALHTIGSIRELVDLIVCDAGHAHREDNSRALVQSVRSQLNPAVVRIDDCLTDSQAEADAFVIELVRIIKFAKPSE